MNYKIGDILLGKYRIIALIGQGAFTDVYQVTHLALNVDRAIKILRKDTPGLSNAEYADYRSRFHLEARLGARLDQPNIIRVNDFEQEGETLFLVMEYAQGGSLAKLLTEASERNEKIPIPDAVQIAIDVAQGLSGIHDIDAVHRDLKPSNILFDRNRRAKISDLGLSQVPGGPSMRSQLSTGVPHPGTPGYMSPEQERISNYLTPASDVYALGLVLFEILTGRVYHSQRPGTGAREIRTEVPAWIDDLLKRMMAKKIEDRPWNGAEVAALLEAGNDRLRLEMYKKGENLIQIEKAKSSETINKISSTGYLERIPLRLWGVLGGFIILSIVIVGIISGINSPESVAPNQLVVTELTSQPIKTMTLLPPSQTLKPTATLTPTLLTPTPTSSPTLLTPTPTPSPTEIVLSSMEKIPAGEFLMGSSPSQIAEQVIICVNNGTKRSVCEEWLNRESSREIYLDDYWIDKTEVTKAMFAAFLNKLGNQIGGGEMPWLTSEDHIMQINDQWIPESGYENHPVVGVTLDGASEYCRWAGRRLPTMEEWEKAARGDLEGKKYAWGDEDPVCEYGAKNGAKFDNDDNCDDTGTEPVMSYSANGYGLYDMTGNVSEWTTNYYARGGSFMDTLQYLRIAYNHMHDLPMGFIGFRCVSDVHPQEFFP